MNKIKVIFVGDASVGKTCLITQFISNTFSQEHILTAGADKSIKECIIEEKKLIYEIWDTLGQERFRTANKIFMKNANITIFVVDITNKKSFDGLIYWYKEVNENLNVENLITAIAANKSDLYEKREINIEEIKEFKDKNKIDVLCETSAMDHESVENLFTEIGKKYIEKEKKKLLKKINNDEISFTNSIKIDNKNQKKKKNQCC